MTRSNTPFTMLATALLWINASLLSAQQTYALVVGIDDYATLQPLQFAARDAVAISTTLARQAIASPENIVLLRSGTNASARRPTRENIQASLDALTARMNEDDTLIIAFSGHGVQIDDAYGHLCPQDADAHDAETMISLRSLYNTLESTPGRSKILLLDACRYQLGLRETTVQRSRAASRRLRTPQTYYRSRSSDLLIFYACSPGSVSLEDASLRHGVFAHFLLQGLNGKAAVPSTNEVSMLGLCDYVTRNVIRYTRQTHAIEQFPVLFGATSHIPLLKVNAEQRAGEHIDAGDRHLKNGDYAAAEQEYRKALALTRDKAPAHIRLGYALYHLQETDAAMDQVDAAIRLDAEYVSVYITLGDVAYRAGRYADAIRFLERAATWMPHRGDVHFKLGNARFLDRSYARAIDAYKRTLAIQPDHTQARTYMQSAARRLQQRDATQQQQTASSAVTPNGWQLDRSQQQSGKNTIVRQQFYSNGNTQLQIQYSYWSIR